MSKLNFNGMVINEEPKSLYIDTVLAPVLSTGGPADITQSYGNYRTEFNNYDKNMSDDLLKYCNDLGYKLLVKRLMPWKLETKYNYSISKVNPFTQKYEYNFTNSKFLNTGWFMLITIHGDETQYILNWVDNDGLEAIPECFNESILNSKHLIYKVDELDADAQMRRLKFNIEYNGFKCSLVDGELTIISDIPFDIKIGNYYQDINYSMIRFFNSNEVSMIDLDPTLTIESGIVIKATENLVVVESNGEKYYFQNPGTYKLVVGVGDEVTINTPLFINFIYSYPKYNKDYTSIISNEDLTLDNLTLENTTYSIKLELPKDLITMNDNAYLVINNGHYNSLIWYINPITSEDLASGNFIASYWDDNNITFAKIDEGTSYYIIDDLYENLKNTDFTEFDLPALIRFNNGSNYLELSSDLRYNLTEDENGNIVYVDDYYLDLNALDKYSRTDYYSFKQEVIPVPDRTDGALVDHITKLRKIGDKYFLFTNNDEDESETNYVLYRDNLDDYFEGISDNWNYLTLSNGYLLYNTNDIISANDEYILSSDNGAYLSFNGVNYTFTTIEDSVGTIIHNEKTNSSAYSDKFIIGTDSGIRYASDELVYNYLKDNERAHLNVTYPNSFIYIDSGLPSGASADFIELLIENSYCFTNSPTGMYLHICGDDLEHSVKYHDLRDITNNDRYIYYPNSTLIRCYSNSKNNTRITDSIKKSWFCGTANIYFAASDTKLYYSLDRINWSDTNLNLKVNKVFKGADINALTTNGIYRTPDDSTPTQWTLLTDTSDKEWVDGLISGSTYYYLDTTECYLWSSASGALTAPAKVSGFTKNSGTNKLFGIYKLEHKKLSSSNDRYIITANNGLYISSTNAINSTYTFRALPLSNLVINKFYYLEITNSNSIVVNYYLLTNTGLYRSDDLINWYLDDVVGSSIKVYDAVIFKKQNDPNAEQLMISTSNGLYYSGENAWIYSPDNTNFNYIAYPSEPSRTPIVNSKRYNIVQSNNDGTYLLYNGRYYELLSSKRYTYGNEGALVRASKPNESIKLTIKLENCSVLIDGESILEVNRPKSYGSTLRVMPDEGYEFKSWSDGDFSNPRTYRYTEDVELTAICTKIGG